MSRDLGVLVSIIDDGKTWTARNDGLPTRSIYPFTSETPSIITGLAVDPFNADRVAITTVDTLFVSDDMGATWAKIALHDPFKTNDQITCVALVPKAPDGFAVGTSFHGFFETNDRGRTWTSLSEPLTPLKLGGGNYEEIAALAYDPVSPDRIWFNLGFGKGIYIFRKGTNAVQSLALPTDPDAVPVRDIHFDHPSYAEGWTLETTTDTARWSYRLDTATWTMVEKIQDKVALSPDKAARMAKAADKYGIYVSSFWASGKKLQNHIAFLKAQGLNAMVVDFKDDNGYLTYDTSLIEPQKIGAVQKRFKLDDVVQAAHTNGLYLIGRIVVFRDKQLYNSNDFAYAAWDKAAKGPWRYLKKTVDSDGTGEESTFQGEYWVDPYSEHVWDYNIAIARELQDRGVDEVQFDYIRFPSDGDVGGITWRFRKPGMESSRRLQLVPRQGAGEPLDPHLHGRLRLRQAAGYPTG